MARDGEILNKSLLQKVADYLNIGGVRRMPSSLNTDQVQMVYDLSPKPEVATPGGGDGEFFVTTYGPYHGPVGENEIYTRLIVGDGVTAWRVDTIEIELEFTTVGLATMDNNVLSLQLMLKASGGDPGYLPIITERLWVVIQDFAGSTDTTYQNKYNWSLNGGVPNEWYLGAGGNRGWRGQVPPHVFGFGEGFLDLELHIRDEGGPLGVVGFPAGTTLTTTVTGRKGTNGIMPTM